MASTAPEGLDRLLDHRLGRIAVRRGLIDEARLQEALQDQAEGVRRGRKKPRRLGVILAERRWISDADLARLLEEQEALVLAAQVRRRDDSLLGRILVDAGLCSAEHVEEALKAQSLALEHGGDVIPLLGELLVAQGHARREDVDQALELQQQSSLHCAACGKDAPLDAERCACGGSLESAAPPEPEPPPEPAEAPGLPAVGRYQIRRLIGRGGVGAVYEALDPSLQRRVALKVLRSELEQKGTRETEVRRFNREARLAARLPKHPCIVEIYETGGDAGRHFIAMEFIEGKTFGEWRKSGPPLRRQIHVLAEVCRAVQHAHEHGVLHRDLKPRNVLVDANDRPFVLDFGLARPMNEGADVSGVICGTAAYMSPEQATGAEDIDGRADVYSLGVMLYEILSGRSPFEGADRKEILRRVREGAVPPAGGLARSRGFPNVDAAIQAVCRKAMSPKREDRFADARSLAEALEGWLQSKETPARAEAGTARKPGGRRRAYLIASALAAACLVLAVAVAALMPGPGDRAVRRGEALSKAGELERALEAFDQALKENPSHPGARAGRAEARQRLLGAAARDVEERSAALDRARLEAESATQALQGASLRTEASLRERQAASQKQLETADRELRRARERLKALAEAPGP